MRNGTTGQLGKYVRASLAGSACGLAAGAVYAAFWGLMHWTVTGRGLSSTAAPWLLAVGTAMGLLVGLAWATVNLGQRQAPTAAGGRQRVFGAPGINRLTGTATLRRLRG